jgi:hypothetical protein
MFDSLTRKFQFRFKDRMTAANILGDAFENVYPLSLLALNTNNRVPVWFVHQVT